MLITLLFVAVCCVAFTNGANANFKGVASLYGSGTASLRTAVLWGTLTTFAGAITALFAARGLLGAFSGKGLVPDALTQSPSFLLAVAVGSAATSFLATRLSFPVSTTHALVGALIGAGLAGGDHTVHFGPLVKTFVNPLFFSPLIAIAVGALIYFLLKGVRLLPDHRTRTLDTLHFLSGGAASFARGLNDTPKMAALLIVAKALDVRWDFALVAVTMALGGLLDARNVAETLGKKITGMNPGEGFAANLATAILVNTASFHSLPVSTTHVSVGSLLGIGIVTRKVHWKSVGQIVLSWLITLPCAAALAALAASLFSA
ncbi:MAG: inorganic phosphate transporter [Chthoniobacteraceae bacterium]